MGKIISMLAKYLIGSLVVKSVVLFAIFFLIQALVPYLISLLPKETNLNLLFNSLPDSVWFYVNYFKIPTGIVMVLGALLTRFLIRRIPVIG